MEPGEYDQHSICSANAELKKYEGPNAQYTI